ncbi:MAG: hypothetical protein DRI83_07765 [Bacteroidetes bacterium]|nr:MAG: hypothetical protein DRI83_07765 [Bacteroidota bacterium]
MYRQGGTEGYYKNLVPLLRNEIGLIPRGLAPRIINFKDFFIDDANLINKLLHNRIVYASSNLEIIKIVGFLSS